MAEPGATEAISEQSEAPARSRKRNVVFVAAIIIIVSLAVYFFHEKTDELFTEDFHTVNSDSLQSHGWFLQSEEKEWWNKRAEMSSHLTLFTLPGDNWADSTHAPGIKNLLLRKISSDCFTAEIHADGFVPLHRWQQAGILLLADTNFRSKSLRLSLAYNDFFGGYNKPKEIIIQAITSSGKDASHPEEIIHLPLFSIEPNQDSLVASNLKKSALRIEKNGTHYRFLYATGQADNFAFKEALSKDLDFRPRYIGIFALEGFVNEANYLPVHIACFSLNAASCSE